MQIQNESASWKRSQFIWLNLYASVRSVRMHVFESSEYNWFCNKSGSAFFPRADIIETFI